jgi:hypothetical protein
MKKLMDQSRSLDRLTQTEKRVRWSGVCSRIGGLRCVQWHLANFDRAAMSFLKFKPEIPRAARQCFHHLIAQLTGSLWTFLPAFNSQDRNDRVLRI